MQRQAIDDNNYTGDLLAIFKTLKRIGKAEIYALQNVI